MTSTDILVSLSGVIILVCVMAVGYAYVHVQDVKSGAN